MSNLYKYIFSLFFVVSLSLISGCGRTDYAVQQLRNDAEVAKSAQYPGGLSKDEALNFIAFTADAAANKLDPEKEIKPISTSQQIIEAEKTRQPGQQNVELVRIAQFVSAGPQGFGALGLVSILGFGAMAVGVVGRFMGPPFNVIGSSVQMIAQRFLPNYDSNRKAAVATITSVDVLLTNFGDIFSSLDPETQTKMKSIFGGKDPVNWAKSILSNAQHDLGYQDEVSSLITEMKKTISTKDGYLAVDDQGADAFVKKHV